MESLELTFKFDDEYNSLTRFNGLPIDIFATFLKSLAEAIGVKNSSDLVVSEIKGNCYAPVLSTKSATKYAEIKVLHESISSNSYQNLTIKQKNYARTLKNVLGKRYNLDVYDNDKSYYKKIKEITFGHRLKYYFESTAIRGTVSQIGGKTLNSKPKIMVSKYEHDIEITSIQDEVLKEFYKNGVLEFYIIQKINAETSQIESAILDNFVFIRKHDNNIDFASAVDSLSAKFGYIISEQLNIMDNE